MEAFGLWIGEALGGSLGSDACAVESFADIHIAESSLAFLIEQEDFDRLFGAFERFEKSVDSPFLAQIGVGFGEDEDVGAKFFEGFDLAGGLFGKEGDLALVFGFMEVEALSIGVDQPEIIAFFCRWFFVLFVVGKEVIACDAPPPFEHQVGEHRAFGGAHDDVFSFLCDGFEGIVVEKFLDGGFSAFFGEILKVRPTFVADAGDRPSCATLSQVADLEIDFCELWHRGLLVLLEGGGEVLEVEQTGADANTKNCRNATRSGWKYANPCWMGVWV